MEKSCRTRTCYNGHRAPVAQLDRASGYEPEGRMFESCRAHHKVKRSKHLRTSVASLRWRLDLLFFMQTLEAESGTEDHSHASGNPGNIRATTERKTTTR